MASPVLRLVPAPSPAPWEEPEIKALSREDRAGAIDAVARKYRDRLFYHALYIVKDWDEAYDVVQEVFIRAIREPRFFEPEFRMQPWLFRVTSNLCFNLVRDKRRRGVILETSYRPESTRADQIDRVFAGERREEILAAVERMTDDHREILMLRYYDDLSYAEIAQVLDIKMGTVMSRLSRARGRLLETMGESESLER